MSHRLVSDMMLPAFNNPILAHLDDGAVLSFDDPNIGGGRLAFSTDSYVVDPLFFPGGNIGDLAVNGTVNDLAMCGAVPRYLSCALIVEEGFETADLAVILDSMRRAADLAGVQIVTGDTKVVPKGAADKLFINTSGIGQIADGIRVGSHLARPGDRVIVSGSLADHGMTILTQREGLSFDSPIQSDSACLNHLVAEMLATCPGIHVLRDPTRGGLATALNEIASQSQVGIRIREEALPVTAAVAGVCELLGFDPLCVANEGKLIAFVEQKHAEAVLAVMHANERGQQAVIIGEVVADDPGRVFMQTCIGGTRIVDMLTGEQLPRIC